ncbi:JmjC domain-containing protein [Pseudoalteromonas xiamenensis]
MYELNINGMSISDFLSEYWQKKPLLIKGGFANFEDPIDPEELAGLAMEESIESRLVTNHEDTWEAHHGPFEDFTLLSDTNSTLLVQAVDHWHPTAAELIEPFRFIPNWRIDDLMISYSTPGGGVGPHLDQYDVFIIQGLGKRHWRVGLPNPALKEFAQNKSLLQVEAFEAVIDAVLEPGDILYIPPGHPHEGYAVENALNYSVGFRAPNQRDLISSFADHLIDTEQGKVRYNDPEITERDSVGLLSDTEISKIRNLIIATLNDSGSFQDWLGKNLSTPKHDMDLYELEEPYTVEDMLEILNDDIELYRAGGVRAIYQIMEDNLILLSINGENHHLTLDNLENVKLLCDETVMNSDQFEKSQHWLDFIQLLTNLINEGIYYFPEMND